MYYPHLSWKCNSDTTKINYRENLPSSEEEFIVIFMPKKEMKKFREKMKYVRENTKIQQLTREQFNNGKWMKTIRIL